MMRKEGKNQSACLFMFISLIYLRFRALYSNEITHKMLHGTSNYIIEPSYTACEDLIHGRVSYGGMNPEIERLIAVEKFGDQKVKEEQERLENQKMKTDVSDNDMAKFYTSVVKTIAKKYEGVKRLGDKRKKKQEKFMKPKDD